MLVNAASSDLLMSMADGIGDLTFSTPEWVNVARDILETLVSPHSNDLAKLPRFTLCEVAQNSPAYLHMGSKFAWHAKFTEGAVEVGLGELTTNECDYKITGDHSIISNLARIQYHGKDPKMIDRARERLVGLSKWEMHGQIPDNPILSSILRRFHDHMAARTMPRFVFMTPEWVSTARHILSTRAASKKYAEGIKNVEFIFSEEFINTPRYAFPDGSHGGFWVQVSHGEITVGAGPLPESLQPADMLTKGEYTPVVPVGRTVNAAMTEQEKKEQESYAKAAFRYDKTLGKRPVEQSQPSGRGPMPESLGRIFAVLHDELSKRTSGELPLDFDVTIRDGWNQPQPFDRDNDYDPSWVKYDEVDIYGNPIK